MDREPTAGEALQERTIMLTGLDCPDCARKLAESIRMLDNVEEAAVSFTSGKLYLRYRGRLPDIGTVISAAGYGWQEDGEEIAGLAQLRTRATRAGLSALFLLLALTTRGTMAFLTFPFLLAAVISGGMATFKKGIQALGLRRMDMNVLMTVAVFGALLIGEWWEAATVAFLFSASNALETYTAEKNRRSIRVLMDNVPETAHLLREGKTETVPLEEVKAGEEILIRPGERIPLDGVVLDGSSYVAEAAVTGEPLPVAKGVGSPVYAGTLNGNGSLYVRVLGPWADSTLARIVRLVEEAQLRRAPVQQLVDRFAGIYTPAVITAAVLIGLAGPLLWGGGWQPWLYRGLALLIVACPCALVVSTPVSIAAALANAARHGVLIKGGAYLEAAADIRGMLFDKTGTLTKGTPTVSRVLSLTGGGEKEIVRLAASLEAHSEHPLAGAVRNHAVALGVETLPVSAFAAYPGKGVSGMVDGQTYFLGTLEFLAEKGVEMPGSLPIPDKCESALYLGAAGNVIGMLAVSDSIRQESAEVIKTLRYMGIVRLGMLTGDRREAALALATRLGLDDVYAKLLPGDKEALVRAYKEKYGRVAMVGDGINDAPALAAADLGIAMGVAGSPTALETADVALMGDRLDRLPFLFSLSRRTLRVIRQNIALSLLLKVVAVLLVIPGWLTLWLAILADMGASLIVTANGMRLFAVKPDVP